MQRLGFKISKWLIIITAALQLALSQIHIKAVSIVFSQPVAFYLFLFILFGLLVMFTLFSTKTLDKSNLFKITCSCAITGGAGIYTGILLWRDYKNYASIEFQDISKSLCLLLSGAAVYLLGSLMVFVIYLLERRERKP